MFNGSIYIMFLFAGTVFLLGTAEWDWALLMSYRPNDAHDDINYKQVGITKMYCYV